MGFHYEKPSALLPIQILTTKKKKKKKKEEVERIGIEKETLCFEGRQTTYDPSISPGLIGVSTCSLKNPPGS